MEPCSEKAEGHWVFLFAFLNTVFSGSPAYLLWAVESRGEKPALGRATAGVILPSDEKERALPSVMLDLVSAALALC